MDKKKSAIGNILVIVITAIMALYPMVVPSFAVTKMNDVVRVMFNTLLGIGGVIVMKKVYGTEFKFKGIEVLKGIFGVWGLVFLPLVVLNLMGEHSMELTFVQAIPSLIISMLTGILAGVSEELIFRGTVFNVFRERFGEGKRGIFVAAVLSSAIFGAIHLTNLIFHPNLVVFVTSQVVYAALFGIAFACAYYVTGNIWVVSVIHAIIDSTSFFWRCFSKQAGGEILPSQDIPFSVGVTNVVVIGFFAVAGLILLFIDFKKKEKKKLLTAK